MLFSFLIFFTCTFFGVFLWDIFKGCKDIGQSCILFKLWLKCFPLGEETKQQKKHMMHSQFQLLRKVPTFKKHFILNQWGPNGRICIGCYKLLKSKWYFQTFDVDMMTTFLSIFGNDETNQTQWWFSVHNSFFKIVCVNVFVVYFSSDEIYIVLSVLCLSGVTSLIFTPNSIHTEYWII